MLIQSGGIWKALPFLHPNSFILGQLPYTKTGGAVEEYPGNQPGVLAIYEVASTL